MKLGDPALGPGCPVHCGRAVGAVQCIGRVESDRVCSDQCMAAGLGTEPLEITVTQPDFSWSFYSQ